MPTPDWDAVTAHAEARLNELRARLEADVGEIETAALRARIRELKLVLGLSAEKVEAPKLETVTY